MGLEGRQLSSARINNILQQITIMVLLGVFLQFSKSMSKWKSKNFALTEFTHDRFKMLIFICASRRGRAYLWPLCLNVGLSVCNEHYTW